MEGGTENTWNVRFEIEGRTYRLFKRQKSPAAPWYVHLQSGGRRYKKSLETPDVAEAQQRARLFIEIARGHRWQSVLTFQESQGEASLFTIIELYKQAAPVAHRTSRNNILSMQKIVERVAGRPVPPELVPLTSLTKHMLQTFQERTVEIYQHHAPKDEQSQREAKERALRSSRSTINQARCLFSRKSMIDLPDRYQSAGVFLPSNITEFMSCKLRGNTVPSDFKVPPDHVVDRVFKAIEQHRDDEPMYLAFWLSCGAGLRRKEIRFCRWEHFVEVDGRWRIRGGIGKDGKLIDVPLQARAAGSILPFKKERGYVITERSDRWAKRLNKWLTGQGWTETRKRMHELRKFVGSRIYQRSPVAAMRFLRHKSIKVTESNYVTYAKINIPDDVL